MARQAVLFSVRDGSGNDGLWVSDGADLGRYELTGIGGADMSPPFGSGPFDFRVSNGALLFNIAGASGQDGMWATNGTAAGTHELTGSSGAPGRDPNLGGSSLSIAGALDNTGTVQAGDASESPNAATAMAATAGPTLTTLVSFNGDDGRGPVAGLIADAAGESLRHDIRRRGERRRHGVRDRQDRRQIRRHAHHAGQLQRRQREWPGRRSDRRRRRRPLRHDIRMAGRTAPARCSRSPRPAADTPARRPRWSASTAPTGIPAWPV